MDLGTSATRPWLVPTHAECGGMVAFAPGAGVYDCLGCGAQDVSTDDTEHVLVVATATVRDWVDNEFLGADTDGEVNIADLAHDAALDKIYARLDALEGDD